MKTNGHLDRLPPYSEQAEQGVMGCMLLSPECIGECVEKFKAGGSVFYDLRHRELYECLVGMYDRKVAIDTITVRNELGARFENVGGMRYVSTLPDCVPSAANLSYYAEIVLENFTRRKLIATCTEIQTRAYDENADLEEVMDESEKAVLSVVTDRATDAVKPISSLVSSALTQIENYIARDGGCIGIPTGFVDLDKLMLGMKGGEMIVIAGRPGSGKSSISMNIAEHAVLREKLPVGVFNLEMTAESLMLRMLCSQSRISLRNIQHGFLAERDFPRLTAAAAALNKAPLYIDDTSGLSILQLRAKARRMWQQHGIRLFIVDYLQLLHSTNRRVDNRQQEVADISAGIKALAKELNVPVIALSQLNRELEKATDRRPKLSMLRESGAVEQEADFVGLLYKPEEEQPQNVNLLIAKQRNGPTGEVRLIFLDEFTKFQSAARMEAEDVPRVPYVE